MSENISSDNNISPKNRTSQFDELVVAQETSNFSLSSQWNDINFRNDVEATGTGVVTNNSGSFKISSGTTIGSKSSLISKQAGIYKPGVSAIAGVGTRLKSIPTTAGTWDSKWGYFDAENGFGFGRDYTGLYVFFRRNKVDDKIYQPNWNQDSLDGTGPSGFSLDSTEIAIYQIDYTWYGAGEIAWVIAKRAFGYDSAFQNRQLIHVYDPYEDQNYSGPSLLQPDLPFTNKVDNGDVAEDIIMEVTGRSFRRLDNDTKEKRRSISQNLTQYTLTSAQGIWEPIFAFRKTDRFNGFINQVNTRLGKAKVYADQNTTFRVTLGDEVDEANSTFSAPNTWGNASSANEIAKGANINITNVGKTVSHTFIRGASGGGRAGKQAGSGLVETNSPIGRDDAITVWARADSANTTIVDLEVAWNEAF